MMTHPKNRRLENILVNIVISIILLAVLSSCVSKHIDVITFRSGEIVFNKDGKQILSIDYFPWN
jgi:hypothetical protein